MFNSSVLDLAAGLVFCFLAVSLATGAVVEAISSFLKLRAGVLAKGVGQLLNDPGLTALGAQLYAHAAINPRGPGAAAPQKDRPAYIDRQLFAKAMMDITGVSSVIAAAAEAQPEHAAGAPAAGRPRASLDALHAAVTAKCQEVGNRQLHGLLTGIVNRSFGEADRIQTELADWFDHAMDRVGGAYKRWTQLTGFIVAVFLAAALNIDSVQIARTLWLQPTVAAKLAADGTLKSADAIDRLSKDIPIGWPNGFGWKLDKDRTTPVAFGCRDWAIACIGWLITALATLFGAPFWFDLLQNVVRLKGAGPSPKEKAEGKGASA